MRADARLHPAVAVAHPVLAADRLRGSVSSQASVASKRCVSCSVPGAAIQSPRDTSSWRSSTTPADCAGRDRRRPPRRHGALRPRVALWPLGKTAAPRRRRARGRVRCGPTAVRGLMARRHRHRAPRTAPAAQRAVGAFLRGGQLLEQLSSDWGRRYQGVCSGWRHVVAAQRRHRHDAGQRVDAGLLRRSAASASRTASKAAAGSSTASSLLTANTMLGTRSSCASSAWRRVCGSSSTGGRAPVELGDVDQHHGGIAAGGGGDHVARVLLVARRVGDDELARAASRSSGRPRRW